MGVSVIIPTFNRSEATGQAVASVLAQTRPPDEIIIVDDASSPPVTLEALGGRDPRLRLVTHAVNRGASAARQAGIAAATGRFIAFLDSDDRWLPDKLAMQFPMLESSGSDLVAVSCGWREAGARSRRCIPIASADPVDFASGCWFSPGSTVVLPRAAFDVVGPFDAELRRLEDVDWFLRFALAGGRLEVAPEIGAVVSIGQRARSGHVRAACSRILDRRQGSLDPRMRRNLGAYLDLELAAAARNDGRPLTMAFHLARSFLARPRRQIPLRNWWQQQG